MKYKNILLTGASGQLGRAIASSGIFHSLLAPAREELDISNADSVKKFFDNNDFDAVIHCAALARMKECGENPIKAIETNIIGTGNLVAHAIIKEKKTGRKIRFIHISTDAVYPGTRGNYNESSETVPYNMYGWTKLGAECTVQALANFCIIRTSFFDPESIEFKDAATDAFSSKAPINYIVRAISTLLGSNFIGTINVGRERRSDYGHYREFKPEIRQCRLEDIQKTVPFKMYKDSSMDITLWKKVEGMPNKNTKPKNNNKNN